MNPRLQRGLLIIAIILTPFIIGLFFTFEILKIPYTTDMQNQTKRVPAYCHPMEQCQYKVWR